MNEDLRDLLKSLKSHDVAFLVVGAHALAAYIRPRFTEDLDLWIERSSTNAERLAVALSEFGFEISTEDAFRLLDERHLIRLGEPPNRVDLLGFLGPRGSEFNFEEVQARSLDAVILGIPVRVPARDDLKEMKRKSGRPKDLRDLAELNEAE